MCKKLSELLNADEPLFSIALEQLERASGNPSADVRLTAEIIGKVHIKSRELGLDPNDSTGRELYNSLVNMVVRHDNFLADKLGAKDSSDVQDILPRVKQCVDDLDIPKSVWVLKASVAKKMLKTTPPKKVMKHLGYRSIDSMLKREPIGEIYGALRFVESEQWLNTFLTKYNKLQATDFETRQIEIIHLDPEKWGDITKEFVHKKRHNITHLKELGVILMLPMPMRHMRGIAITALPLLLHYVNEIRLYSSYFKLQQVRPDFGNILATTLTADPSHHAVMAGQNVHWRVVQRYFGKQEDSNHPEIFEPHVQPEDLHWRKAEEVLYKLEPALHFWHDLDYVGAMHDGRPVSFSLMDMAVNYVNGFKYGQQAVYHFRESLWNEIFIRYMGQRTLENQILKQLNNEMLEPEIIALSLGRI